jgi:flagellar assembly factor FliW
MIITTKFHGTREYSAEDILTFKKGLPGFEQLKKYILFPVENNEFFSILQSIEDESIGLVVTSPFEIVKNYEFKLDDNLIEKLAIKEPEDVLVMSTVTLSSMPENITINLKAPIIINIKEKLGEQIILEKEQYKVKHPLI